MFTGELPRLACPFAPFGAVEADVGAAPWLEVPAHVLVETTTGDAPEQGTRVRVAWDHSDLRVLFEADDTEPWATLTARNAALYTEEVVEVFIDPVGDRESYFEIEVNPLNAVLDLVLRRNRSGYTKEFAWDCEGLRTAVARSKNGWVAELAIPFTSITATLPKPGERWRANFLRIDRPTGKQRELSAWSPTGRPLFHVPERFGWIEFAGGAV